MSENTDENNDVVEISIEDIYAPVSDEYIEASKGQLQLYDEEAKVRKNSGGFIKLTADKEQLLFFPQNDFKGNLNVGRIVWQAYNTKQKRSIRGKTKEEVLNNPEYNEQEFNLPGRRHLVDVILLDDESGKALKRTYDMSKTVFLEIFTEHLTDTDRIVSVKKSSTDDKKTIIKTPKKEKVKALLATINKK